MPAVPRLVITAPSSGHGKTAVSVGLIAALAARGLTMAGFKIGPDHVDSGYLGLAAGRVGRNLDPRMVGGDLLPSLFLHGARDADVAIVEGTMGLYDGLSGRAGEENTAQVAGMLRAPVVLVVDAAAMGQSAAALVHGFRAYDDQLWLGGVILTRVSSDRHEEILRSALGEIGVPVLGVLRRHDFSQLPPRTYGMVPVVDGAVDAVRAVRRLGERMLARLDLERLLALARSAPPLSVDTWSPESAVGTAAESAAPVSPAAVGYATDRLPAAGERPIVAVAGSDPFSFSYPETGELLTAAGAEVVPFDPVRDERLPAGTRALVFGGGFPEAFADELSANRRLQDDVVALAREDGPIYAENAGLLWLVKEHDGREMCGMFDASAQTTNLLVLGYRDAVARASSSVVKVGARVVGHKHHRATVTPRAGDNAAWQWNGGRPEGFIWRKVHASFLTVHWAGHPEMAARFVAAIG
jgi:cobyrinic acid a,c-diamide synthase